jgi:hypothetical protein
MLKLAPCHEHVREQIEPTQTPLRSSDESWAIQPHRDR